MSKLEFALQSSLVLAIVSHGFVTAQTRTAPQRESASAQEAHRIDVRGRQADTPGQAVERYKEYDFGLEPSPEEAKKFYKQGVKYGRMKLFTEAKAAFELAILLKPNYTDAYFGLGHAYFDLGRWEEAIQAFRRVIELDPEDTESYVWLHQINERMAREEKTRIYSQPPPRTLTNSRTETAVAKPSPLNNQPKPESRFSSNVNSPPGSNRNVLPANVKLGAATNPMLPQTRLRLNLSSRIAPDRGAIPKPMKNSATAIPVNLATAPQPSISSRPDAGATKSAVNNGRDGEMSKPTADKIQDLSNSAIPDPPPSNDGTAAVGVGVASPVKRAAL